MNYLTVDIYDNFDCIAATCPNTCCIGWKIAIDEPTYKKMIEKEAELEVPANDWIDKKENNYYVKLNNQKCPMLTEDKLCNVVLKLGSEYLSNVCQIYPRVRKQYGNFIEEYLVLSCPEVIMQLMNKESVEIYVSKDLQSGLDYPHTKLYFFEVNVRTHIMNILKSAPDISLSSRLFLSFSALTESIKLYQSGKLDIDCFEQNCTKITALPIIEEELKNAIDDKNRYQIIKQLLLIIYNTNSNSENRFIQYIHDAAEYFSKNNTNQYIADLTRFREEFCSSYQNFYTNYWVCRLFSDILSIPEYENSKELFIYFAVGFALIQAISLVYFSNNGKIERDEYIYIITTLDRLLEHNSSFCKLFITEIAQNKLDNAAGLLLFIIS